MSANNQQSLEDLFASLKEVSKKELTQDKPVGKSEEPQQDADVLQLDDDEEGKKDTEKIFRDIELELKKLPKLHNEFDKLASKKHNKSNAKKSFKDVLPTTVLEEAKEPKQTVSEGKEWFTLPKPSDHMKKQVQRDLLLIKHRAALDPKRHYKKDKWQVPDRFSIGTIVEDKTEFFSSRLTNKQRKSTILETLMTDDQTNKYFKRKYTEIQVQKTSGKKGHYKKNKDMRRKF
ncbi:rRNA-processing protein Fcf2p [Monosporozyma servazzii]